METKRIAARQGRRSKRRWFRNCARISRRLVLSLMRGSRMRLGAFTRERNFEIAVNQFSAGTCPLFFSVQLRYSSSRTLKDGQMRKSKIKIGEDRLVWDGNWIQTWERPFHSRETGVGGIWEIVRRKKPVKVVSIAPVTADGKLILTKIF